MGCKQVESNEEMASRLLSILNKSFIPSLNYEMGCLVRDGMRKEDAIDTCKSSAMEALLSLFVWIVGEGYGDEVQEELAEKLQEKVNKAISETFSEVGEDEV